MPARLSRRERRKSNRLGKVEEVADCPRTMAVTDVPTLDLGGQTAIVTGAGRGIGEEIATTFARAGANVVAAARTESELEALVEDIESEYEADALAVPTDLREADDVANLVAETVSTFGTPSILVNNAGANISGPPLEHPEENIDTMLEVNLRGTFELCQLFGKEFRSSDLDSGRIINISSVVADLGVPAMTLYGGTKVGLRGITRGLAAELSPDGVTVNSVSPGLTLVDRTEDVIDEYGDQLFDFDRIPAGRVGDPEDIANACLFLASDLAGYITGEDLMVDGGVRFTAGLYR